MLLQTIKSRNLWLWSETITPVGMVTERNKLEAEKAILNKMYVDKSQEIRKVENTLPSKISGISTDTVAQNESKLLQDQKELSNIQANINKNTSELNNLSTNDFEAMNKIYQRAYTDPFKITALQNVDFVWDQSVGESYGIKANFLQAWHNKPVNISFSGVSYIGAFGGKTVGDLSQLGKEQSKWDQIKNVAGASVVSDALTSVSRAIQTDNTNEETVGKYDVIVDDDVYKINSLLSLYGDGMYANSKSKDSSTWIHLLLENELGTDGTLSYASFIGHIKNFTYKENVSKPFLYDFTCQFVGSPVITESINGAKIDATADKNSLKLTVVASENGYSLGYGF